MECRQGMRSEKLGCSLYDNSIEYEKQVSRSFCDVEQQLQKPIELFLESRCRVKTNEYSA
jgi:hypothetical protein